MALRASDQEICQKYFQEANTCDRCGNCCPNYCSQFDPDSNGCLSHPERMGTSIALHQRGILCNLPPVTLFAAGYYCPPVANFLAEKFSIIAQPQERPDGRVVIGNGKEIDQLASDLLLYLMTLHRLQVSTPTEAR